VYHALVRRRLRTIFARLSAGDFDFVVRQFHPRARHWFAGDGHALAGVRTTPDGIAAWYRRLAAVFPGIRFTMKQIAVAGPPWDTLAAVEWSEEVPGGSTLPNQGVFLIRLRWGKALAFHVHCDTARLERNLALVAAGGVREAAAPPLVDSVAGDANLLRSHVA
jgi:ketosteroid isomerase-like protein